MNHVIIASEREKNLFTPMVVTDEYDCDGVWKPVPPLAVTNKEFFLAHTVYRRLEKLAWLPIVADARTVEYPAWLRQSNGQKSWLDSRPFASGDVGLIQANCTHWLPAPPAPEGPLIRPELSNLQKMKAFDYFLAHLKPGGDNDALLDEAIQFSIEK